MAWEEGPEAGWARRGRAAAEGKLVEPRHWVFAMSPGWVGEWSRKRGGGSTWLPWRRAWRRRDGVEAWLVERVAGLLWRLRRVVAFETESVAASLASEEREWHGEVIERAQLEQLPNTN